MTTDFRSCPACSLAAPPNARFCPHCGNRLDDGATEGPVASTRGEPHFFGVVPATATFVLACGLLAGSLVAFVAATWILAVLLLSVAVALFVLFYEAARRAPDGALPRATLAGGRRARSWARFARESVRAWAGAGRRLVRLHTELRTLRAERTRAQTALGDAAYREDETAVASLKARLREIDDAISSRERARTETVADARSHVEDERLSGKPTERLSSAEAETRAEQANADDDR